MRTAPAAHAFSDLHAHRPTVRQRVLALGALCAICSALTPLPARADLGNNPSRKGTPMPQAVQRASGNGTANVAGATSATYTTHARQLETGTVITEYANATGVVFAVAWQGPALPELDSLLGSYFPTFQSEATRTRSSRSIGAPLHVDTGGLVVTSAGRMRGFIGHAYAPTLVPAGVRIQDVLP